MTDDQAWLMQQRDDMHAHFSLAARGFGVTIVGTPKEGHYLRSLSALVRTENHETLWLRVGREYIKWIEDHEVGDHWTGIPDSNAVEDVTRPVVLDSREWNDTDGKRRIRADLMTVLWGRPCSPTDALRSQLDLPESWWAELRRSVDALRSTRTSRFTRRLAGDRRMRDVFGNAVANKYCPARWETVHGDLHWSNLLAPPDFGLLDWELWGSGPVGSDAACLYVFALLVPEIARQVHEVFADVLDTHDGQVAQLRVASRVLNRADEGEYPDLSIPVAKLADNIIR